MVLVVVYWLIRLKLLKTQTLTSFTDLTYFEDCLPFGACYRAHSHDGYPHEANSCDGPAYGLRPPGIRIVTIVVRQSFIIHNV